MERLDCEGITPNHSDDVLIVYVGEGEPARVCGYHERHYLSTLEGWEIVGTNKRSRTA